MKYPNLIGVCVTCSGCNLLENINFEGKYECENHLRLVSPKVQNIISQIRDKLGIT